MGCPSTYGSPISHQCDPCTAKNVFRPVHAPKKMELPCSLFFIDKMRFVNADKPRKIKPGREMEKTRNNPPMTERTLGSCTNMDSPGDIKIKSWPDRGSGLYLERGEFIHVCSAKKI